MKNLYFLLCLLLPMQFMLAQEKQKITTAGGISIAEAFLIKDIVSVKEHGFLVLQSYLMEGTKELEFQIYDFTRTLTNKQTFQFDSTKGEPFVHAYTEWNDHFLLFVSYYGETSSSNQLYVYQYSLPDLELKLTAKVMDAYSPTDLYIPFYLNISPDKSKLALATWSYTIPKDPGKMEVRVLNADLKVIKEYQYLMPYNNLNIHLGDCIVDDEANVYLIGKEHKGSNTLSYKQLETLPGNPFVLAFYANQKEPNLYEIEIKKYRFPFMKFGINKQQELVGLGLYRLGGRKSFSGVCTITLNKEKKSLNFYESEISKEVFQQALGKSPPSFKNANGFRNVLLKDLILKDNAYYLVAEQIYVDADQQRNTTQLAYGSYSDNNTIYPSGTYVTTLKYTLLDIILIKLDTKGTIRWMSRIPKIQRMNKELTNYLSCSVMERERDILIFYNDHPDNFSFKPKDKVKRTELRSAQPMLAKVSCSSGKVKKRKLTSLFGKNTVIRPNFCKKIDEQQVFIYGQKKKWDLTTYRMKIARLGGS